MLPVNKKLNSKNIIYNLEIRSEYKLDFENVYVYGTQKQTVGCHYLKIINNRLQTK